MKKILLVILGLVALVLPNKVSALQESFYEGNYIGNEYIKKFKADGTGKYEQMKFFRRVSDNEPVYCIQVWETLSNQKSIPGYDSNQASYANISQDVWNKINLIAYYGYGYSNHLEDKWYVITQIMIWKELNPESTIYFTNTLNGQRIDKYGNEMSEINELVSHHYDKLSFNNSTYQIKYNERINIQNTNMIKNLNETITFDNDDALIIKRGFLGVTTKKIGLTTIKLGYEYNRYSRSPIVYIDDTGQNLLLPGNLDPVVTSVNFYMPYTDLIINKLDY